MNLITATFLIFFSEPRLLTCMKCLGNDTACRNTCVGYYCYKIEIQGELCVTAIYLEQSGLLRVIVTHNASPTAFLRDGIFILYSRMKQRVIKFEFPDYESRTSFIEDRTVRIELFLLGIILSIPRRASYVSPSVLHSLVVLINLTLWKVSFRFRSIFLFSFPMLKN